MEKLCTAARRFWLVPALLAVSLLLCGTRADGAIKQVTNPRKNVNLSPFEQWISVAECLQNTSTSCPANYTLKIDGWMNVTSAYGAEFCKEGGCKDHTLDVLACIHDVKRDMKFGNKATVKDIYLTVIDGCLNGFDGSTKISTSGSSMTKSGIAFAASVAVVLGLFYNGLL